MYINQITGVCPLGDLETLASSCFSVSWSPSLQHAFAPFYLTTAQSLEARMKLQMP